MNCTLSLARDKMLDGLCPIYLYAHFKSKTMKLSTGQKVAPDAWDTHRQRFKGKGAAVNAANNALTDMIATVNQLYEEYPDKASLTRATFKQLYKKTKAAGGSHTHDFYELLDVYLDNNRGILSDEYLRGFRQVRQALQGFAPTLSVLKIDQPFFSKYVNYLINERGISNNTVKTHARAIRAVMELANAHGVPVKQDYLKFRHKRTDTERFFLTWEELMLLWRLEVKSKAKRNVLDVFLFACFTGLRYSDIKALTPANLQNGNLRFTQQKTQGKTEIALNDYALEIVNRHQGNDTLLPVGSHQKTNLHIKELCRLAGIEQPTQRVLYQGSKRVATTAPKWAMISIHAARHTHATLSLQKGMDVLTISKNLGHRDINTTMIYVKLLDSQRHTETRQAWKKED